MYARLRNHVENIDDVGMPHFANQSGLGHEAGSGHLVVQLHEGGIVQQLDCKILLCKRVMCEVDLVFGYALGSE